MSADLTSAQQVYHIGNYRPRICCSVFLHELDVLHQVFHPSYFAGNTFRTEFLSPAALRSVIRGLERQDTSLSLLN